MNHIRLYFFFGYMSAFCIVCHITYVPKVCPCQKAVCPDCAHENNIKQEKANLKCARCNKSICSDCNYACNACEQEAKRQNKRCPALCLKHGTRISIGCPHGWRVCIAHDEASAKCMHCEKSRNSMGYIKTIRMDASNNLDEEPYLMPRITYNLGNLSLANNRN